MKRLLTLLLLTGFTALQAQTARVQIIHNSPDPAADTVNVYVGNTPLLTDFAYQEATPFIDVTAGTPLDIYVLPQGVTDTAQAVYSVTTSFMANQTYVVVADGVVNASNFATPNTFGLEVHANAREQASTSGNTDVLVHHGSPDAPGVDVVETGAGAGTVVNNLAYPNFAGYLNLATGDYILQVQDSTQAVSVGEYLAPLQTLNLADSAVVVVASGLLNTNANPGEPFELLAVLADGTTLPLPQTTTQAQVIHNVADPAAATVDVWLNDQRILDDFAFRTATPYVDLPANTDITVSITGPSAMDTSGALLKKNFNLPRDSAFTVIAGGVSNDPIFDSVKPLDLFAAPAVTQARTSGETDVQVFHGATDAGAVIVNETTVPVAGLVPQIAFGQFSGLVSLAPADYALAVESAASGNVIAKYGAPLQTLNLADSSLVVLASGFADTLKGGTTLPGFGLYVALPIGGPLVALQELPVGLEEDNPVQNLQYYPVPATDVLHLNWKNDPISEVRLMNLSGQEVRLLDVSGQQKAQVNTSELPAGTYLLQLRTDNGERLTHRISVVR